MTEPTQAYPGATSISVRRLEDYALIGDTASAALVGRHGSIDWFCAPRFDSAACFASLLGTDENGHWSIRPRGDQWKASRRYRPETLILETEFHGPNGHVRLIDFMAPETRWPHIVRIVEGLSGRVPMSMELIVRFEYGSRVPWVHRIGKGLEFVAGPDALRLDFGADLTPRGLTHAAEFDVAEGQTIPFILSWHPSYERRAPRKDPAETLRQTERWWTEWAGRCDCSDEWREPVVRSAIVLKALTDRSTGGIVAAPTTSLPESIGGRRNWDYRYCWLRDATFTVYALMMNGYVAEARSWRNWLLRAIAGQPELMQIMYGSAGETRITEFELPWLPGFRGSAPVRVGNKAAEQFQLDVYGEVMDTMYLSARSGVPSDPIAWGFQKHLMAALEHRWKEPDEGIWEVRGPRRHFTHSKIMAWVAADRAVRSVERFGLEGPVDTWKQLREEIHREVCEHGYDPNRGAFTWFYGSPALDAALLMIPLVGFLPATDPRVIGTVEAVRQELVFDGFVRRYHAEANSHVDGLEGGEGAFLPCTFWLADNLVLQGRGREAKELFERLLGIRNDVGLLSEEYDPENKTMLGNFPQAFTHVSLINTARNLTSTAGPAHHRRSTD
jgi:GH15 family glucan-1,4-alpha-glucosidase